MEKPGAIVANSHNSILAEREKKKILLMLLLKHDQVAVSKFRMTMEKLRNSN